MKNEIEIEIIKLEKWIKDYENRLQITKSKEGRSLLYQAISGWWKRIYELRREDLK